MDYGQSLDWLYSVQQFGIKPGLENTRKLLKALQLPGTGQRFLHVAGTNGKGSTCAFMESVLRAGGERTALFTSPHLIQFRERIQVGGVMMPESDIADSLTVLRQLVNDWQPHPTFFELTLALALDWFDRAGAELVVLETGMGGRLDSTNAVKPVVSVITPIAMDHQQWLGDTIAKIATEKAGIIKPGIPVVSAPQHPEAEAVLRVTAAALGCPITFIDTPWTTTPLPLAGQHQEWNAALALAALETAGILPKPPAIHAGLANTIWPARFQSLLDGHLIIDGAHNPHSMARLIATWQQQFPQEKAHLIFGAVAGKEHSTSLLLLAPIVSDVTFVTVDSPRAVPAADLQQTWLAAVPGISCRTSPSLSKTLLESHGPGSPRRLLCGSLYLCGEALSIIHAGRFEPSTQ